MTSVLVTPDGKTMEAEAHMELLPVTTVNTKKADQRQPIRSLLFLHGQEDLHSAANLMEMMH
jgi:hypothetical protein